MPAIPRAPDRASSHTAAVRQILAALMADRSPRTRYSVALILTSVAVLLTLAVRPIALFAPFLFVLPAVIVCAWYAGTGGGILSAAISAAAIGILAPALIAGVPSAAIAGSLEAIFFALAATVLADQSVRFRTSMRLKLGERDAVERLQAERTVLALKEETARAEAAGANARLAFLAQVSDLLSTSLDYGTTLERLARLAVAQFADWCVIDVVEDGSARRVAVSHADPNRQHDALRLVAFAPSMTDERAISRVLASRRPEIVALVDDQHILHESMNLDHAQILRSLGMSSYIIVPLVARERILGAISLVRAYDGAPYSPRDLESAVEFARRAALGLDNARLYTEAQMEIDERKRAEAEVAAKSEQVESLNSQLQRAMTETHHRVKNNLQIIAAMVDMRVLDDTETVPTSELVRIGAHVRTLAAVHDILTQSAKDEGVAEEISARAVLEKLTGMLQDTTGSVRITAMFDDARLSTRQGTSLAVIVNELVSNAVKHGRDEVIILFGREGDGAVLQVMDNGPGFPAGFDPIAAANTGLDLVCHLSQWDLGGRAEFSNQPQGGGCVTVRLALGSDGGIVPQHMSGAQRSPADGAKEKTA